MMNCREALRWLLHLHHGVSQGGTDCPVTDDEWRAALEAAQGALKESGQPPWRSQRDDPCDTWGMHWVWDGHEVYLCENRPGDWGDEWDDGSGGPILSPTHWMPMADWPAPPPPKEAADER